VERPVRVGTIVEGYGEVAALPILLRRVAGYLDPALSLAVERPHRVPRGRLVKQDELCRAVELVARKVGPGAPILVLLDADDDLPCALGPRLLGWARAQRSDREVSVVVARAEFEAWFLAAAVSLRGVRGLPADLEPPSRPEGVRGAKAWLAGRMPDGYTETIDQAPLAAAFDLGAARAAPSFEKLLRDVARLTGRGVPAA
jgi:hypothetical protein